MNQVSPPASSGQARFRPDIQFLRAVAVMAVLAFHLWPATVSGGFIGVDVFFVVSGYLITHILFTAMTEQGPRSLIGFYSRRVRRLLPQAFLALIATTIATWALVPEPVWSTWRDELTASALYVENWYLIGQAADYNAADDGASPVQHYWSLGVEEQFYLVWPLLLLAVWLLTKRRHWLITLLAAVSAFSLGLSATWRPEIEASAYFNSVVRAWEFGAGGLLAVAVSTTWRPAGRKYATLVWAAGLIAVIGSVWFMRESQFPGLKAVVPVAGTAAMLACGSSLTTRTAKAVQLWPIQRVGDLSYGIYLWHWPLIILLPYVHEFNATASAVIVISGSLALAAVCQPIENWIRAGARRPQHFARSTSISAGILILCTAVAASAPHSLLSSSTQTTPTQSTGPRPTSVKQLEQEACYGAAAMAPGAKCGPSTSVTPSPNDAARNLPEESCKTALGSARVTRCTFGNGPLKVALTGDSHAQRWLPALKLVAASQGWTLTTYLKGSCPFGAVTLRKYKSSCTSWNAQVAQQLADNPPDLLITAAASGADYDAKPGESGVDAGARGAIESWTPLHRKGTKIVVLRDNPLPGFARMDPPACVSSKGTNACSFDEAAALKPDSLQVAAQRSKLASVIDLTAYFCRGGRCPAVIGNVLVYRDGQHIIDTYAETLAPVLAARLAQLR